MICEHCKYAPDYCGVCAQLKIFDKVLSAIKRASQPPPGIQVCHGMHCPEDGAICARQCKKEGNSRASFII